MSKKIVQKIVFYLLGSVSFHVIRVFISRCIIYGINNPGWGDTSSSGLSAETRSCIHSFLQTADDTRIFFYWLLFGVEIILFLMALLTAYRYYQRPSASFDGATDTQKTTHAQAKKLYLWMLLGCATLAAIIYFIF